MIPAEKVFVETKADIEIRECLDSERSFSVVAGAGSGKTTSLITALDYLREVKGAILRRDGKQIACITYTNRAVEVISGRLDWDDLFCVSTLHRFLWNEIKRFTPNIRTTLQNTIIPARIAKKQKDDNGGKSQKALLARAKVVELTEDLELLNTVKRFVYDDNQFSDYGRGKIGHDDVIAIAATMISENEFLRKIIGQKYLYIFVDEAQDTFSDVVKALNKICENEGLPIVGYFGDPMQQIYEKRAGDFAGPIGAAYITKEENFRCASQVINLLNAFRADVQQYPAGKNIETEGTVEVCLIEAEAPEAPRKRYSDEQLARASERFQNVLDFWGWGHRDDVKKLFLVRQMIARRLGFPEFQKLFTGVYASTKAQDGYESGNHPLLKPFIRSIWPLVKSFQDGNMRAVIDTLREFSPAFDPEGENSGRSLGDMKELAIELVSHLSEIWATDTLGEILDYCRESNLCKISDQVIEGLERDPMKIDYDKDQHSIEKGLWLEDAFFIMTTSEVESFCGFINDYTAYSTQHGVKGEEYNDVVVVFDDVEAGWNNYSFNKTLTPDTSGEATPGQLDKSTKLAYVCFSRAEENLRIILYTPDPNAAKNELVANGLFTDDQVTIQNI